jgi:hypothetical protein
MPSVVFEVAPNGKTWTLKRRGGGYESVHPTKEEAVTRGREMRREHENSRLLIRKDNGKAPGSFQ